MERPILEHKHTKGIWHQMKGGFNTKFDDKNLITIYATNDDLEIICKVRKDKLLQHSVQDFEANAKLISIAPELLQIAEMFFDSMKGTDAEDSIIFNITLETLNKLK